MYQWLYGASPQLLNRSTSAQLLSRSRDAMLRYSRDVFNRLMTTSQRNSDFDVLFGVVAHSKCSRGKLVRAFNKLFLLGLNSLRELIRNDRGRTAWYWGWAVHFLRNSFVLINSEYLSWLVFKDSHDSYRTFARKSYELCISYKDIHYWLFELSLMNNLDINCISFQLVFRNIAIAVKFLR